ncbi:Uncharacterized protein OBRU01_17881 [Operophtera brumata]|uniref:Smoothelin domain-containing protein n=1 Tax=Operophtera brumata TaxID=104452 RepID=A0A0L7KZV6_OPEBR|nr:Uncharacterized protein OBRU01_17881 [Operophtera brumata]
MSEGDVSLIRDEDLLRRMWQQTEDFGRKKEIRAHMYRLREERLRDLYSPGPTPAKGCEFSSGQAHVNSFADQTFQSMKSKEVRDAGSPPKEFNYRGQDLKELSNAGWNVESEDRTTDDGRTHVKSLNANIEGRYDVEGGRGQFAAVDRQHQAVTEHQDDNTKMRRDETSSNTAAHEHVVRQTDDGSRFSSSISSSNTSSKFQQVSSTVHETPAIQDYDQAKLDTNRNEKVTRITNTENLRSNESQNGELVSRKIDYPDDNTKVIVETRCLPDGTRITSTRREFRVPAQSTSSEYQTRKENKTYSSQQKSDTRESTSKTIRNMADSRTDDNIRDSKTNRHTTDIRTDDNVRDSMTIRNTTESRTDDTIRDTKIIQHTANSQTEDNVCDSKTIQHTTDSRTDDIVDSQRHVDDHDFRRQLREYAIDDDTNSGTQRINRRHETTNKKQIDHLQIDDDDSQTRYETRVKTKVIDRSTNVRDVRDDKTQVSHQTNQRQRYTENFDQNNRHEIMDTYDNRNISNNDVKEIHYVRDTDVSIRNVPRETSEPGRTPKGSDEPVHNSRFTEEPGQNDPRATNESSYKVPKDTNERLHKVSKATEERTHNTTGDTIVRNTKVEEVVEKKTSSDHYQTTYQSDFQQKKVSNDWSPTHQAWASTLRADTPTTTRPSTRASSPGSRTFKSSSSSLRSSVSPDKTLRKPSSRGSSPSKIDRYSPTRSVTSDRYSSTHSSHSVTEVRTNKHLSPERKPPSGRSPAGYSPERKQPDSHQSHRQRPSVSPEKPQRPSASPERKPSYKTPSDGHPRKESPTRAAGLPSGPSQSPERRPYHPTTGKTCPDTSPTSPYRSSISPERKPTVHNSKTLFARTSPSSDRILPDDLKKPETSPESEVGYKQPTPSHEPQDMTKRPSVSPDRKPGYMRPTSASKPTPDPRRPSKPEDGRNSTFEPSLSPDRKHSKTQVKEDHYKFIDEETKLHTHTDKTDSLPRDNAPSPATISLGKDSPDFSESPLPKGSSSPHKETVIVTENDELYGRINKNVELIDLTNKHDKQTKDIHFLKRITNDTPRDKVVLSRETSPTKFGTYNKNKPHDITEKTEVTIMTSTKDFKFDSINRRDKTSPKKVPETTSPTKRSPRDGTSPVKPPTRDTKFKQTTDFISTEKSTEEVYQKVLTKEHSRHLVTPSSSPTRKPKVETEPSTGQSSPTTSVSGFVYFGSPRTEKPLVTDLDDDFEPGTNYPDESEYTRPESLDLTSPSKKPCRSPSPEKRESPTKETLPRKSSLKKPTNFVNPISPIDKPPSSFRVSPTEDKPDYTGHKAVKKEHPTEPKVSSPVKPKPPLTRRETYEDRCRLILGMADTTENITKETNKPDYDKDSTSVSPCGSPVLQEPSLFPNFLNQDKIVNTNVTVFIANEQDELNKTSNIRDHKSKIPYRESSPNKLQDIFSETTQIDSTLQKKEKDRITISETKNQLPGNVAENINRRPTESPERQVKRKPTDDKPTPKVPQTGTPNDYPRGTSPTKLPRLSLSPERQQSLPVRKSPDKTASYNEPKETPKRTVLQIISRDKTITTENTEFDAGSTTENIQDEYTTTSKTAKQQLPRSRVLESPTRQTPTPDHPLSESPLTPHPVDSSPTRGRQSPERTFEPQPHKTPKELCPERRSSNKLRESPEKSPGYMKTTTAISSKYDTSSTTEDVEETYTSKTVDKKHQTTKTSVSPTRKTLQDVPRSVSPTKPSHQTTGVQNKNERSPERKQTKDVQPKSTKPKDSTPSNLPGYMKTTSSTTSKNDITITKNASETMTSETVEQKNPSMRPSGSPTRKVSGPQTTSPTKLTSAQVKEDTSPERKPTSKSVSTPTKDDVTKKPKHLQPKDRSPTRPAIGKTPGYDYPEDTSTTCMTSRNKKSTTELISQLDITSTTEDFQTTTSTAPKIYSSEPTTQPRGKTILSTERKPGPLLVKDTSAKVSQEKPSDKSTLTRPSVSPDRKPSYMKPTASVTSKFEPTIIRDVQEPNMFDAVDHQRKPLLQKSLESQNPEKIQKDKSSLFPKPEEPRRLRTPSPTKKTMKVTEVSTDFLMSEREQEILDRVHKSLRKLSPERKEKSPSREKSPNKTTTSLQDLDILTESVDTHELEKEDISKKNSTIKTGETQSEKPREDKSKKQKIPSKPSQMNVTPNKMASVPTPSKLEKSQESPTKSRGISPRKSLSQSDRPQSPHGARASGIRPRDQVPFTRKSTPATLSTYKVEKLTTDVKKSNGETKQNVVSKITATSKSRIASPQTIRPSEHETKRIPISKGIKENDSSRKETVTRTSSDSNIKPKKTLPQRMKSKPEIKVNDLSSKSPKYQKPIIKEPYSKLPAKPKSATALNTSIDDDDDIIIDVQQSKSSRENSPDRICPTPVNFADDVGTPRFPDEVSEPDDEYRRRSYHTIHETESVVDDIVEICEDEELFVKNTDITSEHDNSLLSVNDKVNKFITKIESVTKPKDTTTTFKDTERRVHSDSIDEKIKTDEYLLSVSEKVNKFAKGPRDTKDSRSPSRKITEEYDRNTIYQDDYTKLSVNDKAHLFVETAENIRIPKVRLAQKVERPVLNNVDDSLKKDDCLLSVSDKVNKFVKTAENFLTETYEVDQKERKIKEQHEKIMKQIFDVDDNETYEVNEHTRTTTSEKPVDNRDDQPKHNKKETTPQAKIQDYGNPKSKPTERTPTVKVTTLRSSEAVKKAKALFENIASTQKTKDVTQTTTKNTKLTDIGVVKKSPKTDSTIVLHPSVEDMSPIATDVDSEVDAAPHTPRSKEQPLSGTPTRPYHAETDEKPRTSPNRLTTQSSDVTRAKSPMRQRVEITTTKTVLSRYPNVPRAESPRHRPESPRHHLESEKPDKVPGYLRPTKTSQIKEETKVVEESEVSSRRGSGKFGVELRKTSIERSTISSERRRSVEHHQPCIEDIFDLDLLEQMLENVVGYEQRRRIRSQIRVVKTQNEHVQTHMYTKTKHTTSAPNPRAPEQRIAKSPERVLKSAPQRTVSPDCQSKTPQRTNPECSQPKEPSAPVLNGHVKEHGKPISASRLRPHSPEKPKSIRSAKSPVRQPSPVKKRTVSPTKMVPKPKSNRFNEYASAYMKKVGLNEADKVKFADNKIKKDTDIKQSYSYETQDRTSQEYTTTKSFTATSERTSSRDIIEIMQVNGKRSPSPDKITGVLCKPQSLERRGYSPVGKALSPEHGVYSPDSKASKRKALSPERRVYSPVNKASEQKALSPERKAYSPVSKTHVPERKAQSPERKAKSPERKTQIPERRVISPAERLYQRTPSPEFKRHKSGTKMETIINTVYDIEKKIPSKPVQEEKPSWVTNRNLKKITSETRTFSSKKMETEKPKYRAKSPSKVISKPIDVITSSYGPGPLDSDGKPLFGIKALRNGATNFQVKGTVIRQEFHSRNGGEPEGTVSVTAYSSQPEELEQLMASQGVEPPSRIHGLSAITTTKKFGGDTGIPMSSVNTREERASLEHFTHRDRKMDSQIDNIDTRRFDNREQLIGDSRRTDSRTTTNNDKTEKRRQERVTEVRKGQKEERREKVERREDKKTIRQSSVKSLTEKFIKTSSNEHSIGSVDDVVVTTSTDRGGAVTTTTRTSRHHGPTSTHQQTSTITHHEPIITTKKTITVITGSQEPVVTRVVTQGPVVTKTVTGHRQGATLTERSFLDSSTKVTGVQDILTRMKNADIVIEDGDSTEDSEARALLNKFLGATVLMAGMQNYVADQPTGKLTVKQVSHIHTPTLASPERENYADSEA